MTAAFLHFFFLSSFCWVLTEAWQSYLAVIGRIRTRLVRKRFLCLGWGKGAGGGRGGAGTAHPSQYPNPSQGNRGTGGAQTPYPPPRLAPWMWCLRRGELPKGSCSLSPSFRGVLGGGHSAGAPPCSSVPVSPPSSRFASPRGRRLRRLHADQRLRDGELVRGAGGCGSVVAAM